MKFCALFDWSYNDPCYYTLQGAEIFFSSRPNGSQPEKSSSSKVQLVTEYLSSQEGNSLPCFQGENWVGFYSTPKRIFQKKSVGRQTCYLARWCILLHERHMNSNLFGKSPLPCSNNQSTSPRPSDFSLCPHPGGPGNIAKNKFLRSQNRSLFEYV